MKIGRLLFAAALAATLIGCASYGYKPQTPEERVGGVLVSIELAAKNLNRVAQVRDLEGNALLDRETGRKILSCLVQGKKYANDALVVIDQVASVDDAKLVTASLVLDLIRPLLVQAYAEKSQIKDFICPVPG